MSVKLSSSIASDDNAWPKMIKNDKGELTIYQPQPESLKGTILSGRAAISVRLTGSSRPVFGAIWITSTLAVDRDTRIATLTNTKIPIIRFADDVDSTGVDKLRKLIESEIPKWNLEVSVDNIIATLESAAGNVKDQFKNDPPEIIIANKSSILVLIDGDPILEDLQGYDYKRIENSAFFIIFDPKEKSYYLYGEKLWFSAPDVKSDWNLVNKPSAGLLKLQDAIEKSQEGPDVNPSGQIKKNTATVPAIIVRTTPAELIEIKGQPDFATIRGTNLLYVKNSEDNVFMDIKTQKYIILISGRWYTSASMEGPWSFLDASDLPEDFSRIPEGSVNDAVLASVPGTNASQEAILDSQIPQTAEIDRKTATVTVEYDGEPRFEKVDGTAMLYAVNSPQTVLRMSNKYYCVDNGVWFEAGAPKGPWQVAVERPEDVENIKPSSPVYNVKYVYIYDVTPAYVFGGYTPGYYGCYAYGPTVIYGTGYYYRPWYGSFYYPRPVTYGFRMTYNPWTGWGIGFGFSYGGWLHFGYGAGYHGSYWGPPAYRPPHHYPPHGGGFYGRPKPVHYSNSNTNRNLYSNNRIGVKPSAAKPSARPATPSQNISGNRLKNNVYTDKNGQVYQKTNKGWDSRQDNEWKPVNKKPSTGPVTRPATGTTTRPSTVTKPVTRPSPGASTRPSTGTGSPSMFDRSSMDRANQARDRGNTRTNNFNTFSGSRQGASRTPPSRSSGGTGASRRR